MDKSKTLFFTGHRNVYRPEGSDAFAVLLETISSFIEKGYTFFVAGGALGFDTMAAEAVIRLRDKYPHIKLILMLPCKSQTATWGAWQVRKYKRILSEANEIIYTSEEYTKTCMFERDRAMADASSVCIAYCNKERGGTAYTVSYALKKGIAVTNLANAF